jgi:hypothetical protein
MYVVSKPPIIDAGGRVPDRLKRQMGPTKVTRRAILLLALTTLAILPVSPLWSQESGDVPVAIGFINSDGETGVTYSFVASDDAQLELSAIPSAPLGHLVVYLTNLARAGAGVAAPLKASSELMVAAQFHSDWMADHNCFAHTCNGEPFWTTRIADAGYTYSTALAENIAAGYSTAGQAVAAWMESPDHRSAMLSTTLREAGAGYAFAGSSDYHHYWTMDFGARNNAQSYPYYPVVINKEAWSTTNLNVNLYVYGSDWGAEQMRFRNEGDSWSDWEPFCAQKAWTLSCSEGPEATVYAQIRKGAVTLDSSDQIMIDILLSASPSQLLFLTQQGSGWTAPPSYQVDIACCDEWIAYADQTWIKLTDTAGVGSGQTTVYLQGMPTTPGLYYGTITIEMQNSTEETYVDVLLVVTADALHHNYDPMLVSDYS